MELYLLSPTFRSGVMLKHRDNFKLYVLPLKCVIQVFHRIPSYFIKQLGVSASVK
jgi:hypothetical protein